MTFTVHWWMPPLALFLAGIVWMVRDKPRSQWDFLAGIGGLLLSLAATIWFVAYGAALFFNRTR